jgi:plasmid stabilization system protein ParE
LIVEARSRLGGRAWTIADASGHALDLGCGWLHSADRNPWVAVAEEQKRTIDKTRPPWARSALPHGFPEDAQRDLVRLDAFLASFDMSLADRVVEELITAAEQLEQFPELGPKLHKFEPRNVRRLIIGDYELRYERTPTEALILHVWHEREHR